MLSSIHNRQISIRLSFQYQQTYSDTTRNTHAFSTFSHAHPWCTNSNSISRCSCSQGFQNKHHHRHSIWVQVTRECRASLTYNISRPLITIASVAQSLQAVRNDSAIPTLYTGKQLFFCVFRSWRPYRYDTYVLLGETGNLPSKAFRAYTQDPMHLPQIRLISQLVLMKCIYYLLPN